MPKTETPEAEVEAPRESCLCGCGDVPKHKKSRFMPGHDAQLKAQLYREIRDESAEDATRQLARDRVDEFGWPQPAPKKARKPRTTENGDSDTETPAEVAVADL